VGINVGEWEKESSLTVWLIVLPIVLAVAGALVLPATRRRRRTAD
jgi:cytochrome c-type biogenesis protein CcmH/NrfF